MKELTLKEIQEDVFQILLTFDQFCKNNDLTYRLAGAQIIFVIELNRENSLSIQVDNRQYQSDSTSDQ